MLTDNDERRRRRESLDEALATHRRELDDVENEVHVAEAAVAAWQTQWSRYTSRLGLHNDATPAEANAVVQTVTELFQKLREAAAASRNADRVERDCKHFIDEGQALAERLGVDAGEDATSLVDRLRRQLKAAVQDDQRRQHLRQQYDKEAERLKGLNERLVRHRAMLHTLCREAGCESIDQLPDVERRSQRRHQLEVELQRLDESVSRLTGGMPLEDFLVEAAATDIDAAQLELEQVERQLESLDQQREQVDQAIGAEQSELDRMDGNSAAAEAAEVAESLVARIDADVERFLTLRLASGLLQKGIDRYREKNQEPVLRRASDLFRRLTQSFSRLEVDYDSEDNPIVVGVRAESDERVNVEGMSDGTRDQLFLALRLATLEAYLDKHEPLPFVVDDILLNFDDDRASAALEVLADLSTRTQVLFFTHHQHLVRLARNRVEEDMLVTHALRSALPASAGSLF